MAWWRRIMIISGADHAERAVQRGSQGTSGVLGADMFHALGCFIVKRQFCQNMMIYGTFENGA